jgi:hypothetical protein
MVMDEMRAKMTGLRAARAHEAGRCYIQCLVRVVADDDTMRHAIAVEGQLVSL